MSFGVFIAQLKFYVVLTKQPTVEGYSDANWNTRSTETKFTGRYVFTIDGGAIS